MLSLQFLFFLWEHMSCMLVAETQLRVNNIKQQWVECPALLSYQGCQSNRAIFYKQLVFLCWSEEQYF